MFMKAHAQEFPVERMAEILGVSRSGYYHFLEAKQSFKDKENQRLLGRIKLIHESSFRTYEGSMNICAGMRLKCIS